jgi:hypothetical protein
VALGVAYGRHSYSSIKLIFSVLTKGDDSGLLRRQVKLILNIDANGQIILKRMA